MKTGTILMTRGIANMFSKSLTFQSYVHDCLRRHISGDWGDLDEEDKASNDYALEYEERVLSSYNNPMFPKIWIITEWDRSVTTILLPEEY